MSASRFRIDGSVDIPHVCAQIRRLARQAGLSGARLDGLTSSLSALFRCGLRNDHRVDAQVWIAPTQGKLQLRLQQFSGVDNRPCDCEVCFRQLFRGGGELFSEARFEREATGEQTLVLGVAVPTSELRGRRTARGTLPQRISEPQMGPEEWRFVLGRAEIGVVELDLKSGEARANQSALRMLSVAGTSQDVVNADETPLVSFGRDALEEAIRSASPATAACFFDDRWQGEAHHELSCASPPSSVLATVATFPPRPERRFLVLRRRGETAADA